MGSGRFSVNRGSVEKWFSFSFFPLYIVLSCTYQSCNLVRSLKTWGPAVLPPPLWHQRLCIQTPLASTLTMISFVCVLLQPWWSVLKLRLKSRDQFWVAALEMNISVAYFLHRREKVFPHSAWQVPEIHGSKSHLNKSFNSLVASSSGTC